MGDVSHRVMSCQAMYCNSVICSVARKPLVKRQGLNGQEDGILHVAILRGKPSLARNKGMQVLLSRT